MTWWAVGGAVVGAIISSDAAGNAADTQAGATAGAVGEQRRQYDQTRADFAPYREAGTQALGQFQSELGRMPTAAEVMSQPGYQFGLQQGQQAIDRRIAAGGGRVSGASIKAAARFGTDYATSGYNAEYQRRQDRLNRLAALAGIGQTATGASAASGANSANQISNLLTAQGNAAGGAQMAQGNIWGNTTNQLAAIYGRYANPNGSSGSAYGWNPNDSSAVDKYLNGPG